LLQISYVDTLVLVHSFIQADWPLVACRAGTLLLPGIGDHFPWDYEAALRDALLQGGQPKQQ
jgi:hypothetical protein